MCYHKSLVAKYEILMEHYGATLDTVLADLYLLKDRFEVLMSRNEKDEPYSKEELKELKNLQKVISSFTDTTYKKYHENGFDFLPSPVITAGAPEEFKFFNWGLVPFYMSDANKAMILRTQTLNCISEEMYDKPSFKDAAKNGQRCLIPVTGFYEWRWLDEKGKNKIPYYVSFKDQQITSVAYSCHSWQQITRIRGSTYQSHNTSNIAHPNKKLV